MEHESSQASAGRSFRPVLAWLIVPMGLASALYLAAGRLSEPEHRGDTDTYLEVVKDGALTSEALRSPRTLGYPLFLHGVQAVFGSLAPVPMLHWIGFCAAVVLLAFALFRIGGSRGLCVSLTSPLFFSDAVAGYLPVLLPELPSLSLAIASMAAVILATNDPGRRRWWAVVAATVFLAYQFRPAFLFLIVIVPTISVLLHPLFHSSANGRQAPWRAVASATLASAAPFVAFCSMRLFVVGHFGLVSFAGTNVVGITGAILNDEMLPRLSADSRRLAERMLEVRSSSELQEVEREKQASWNDAVRRRFGLDVPSYETIVQLYNPTIHQVATPAARQIYGDDQVAADRAFSRLSREIIALRPVTYAAWVAMACYQAAVTAISLYLMLAVVGLVAAVFLCQRGVGVFAARRLLSNGSFTLTRDEMKIFTVVATVAIVFFCAKALLVSLVEPTIPRYVRPAAVFLPMIPSMVLYCQLRRK